MQRQAQCQTRQTQASNNRLGINAECAKCRHKANHQQTNIGYLSENFYHINIYFAELADASNEFPTCPCAKPEAKDNQYAGDNLPEKAKNLVNKFHKR